MPQQTPNPRLPPGGPKPSETESDLRSSEGESMEMLRTPGFWDDLAKSFGLNGRPVLGTPRRDRVYAFTPRTVPPQSPPAYSAAAPSEELREEDSSEASFGDEGSWPPVSPLPNTVSSSVKSPPATHPHSIPPFSPPRTPPPSFSLSPPSPSLRMPGGVSDQGAQQSNASPYSSPSSPSGRAVEGTDEMGRDGRHEASKFARPSGFAEAVVQDGKPVARPLPSKSEQAQQHHQQQQQQQQRGPGARQDQPPFLDPRQFAPTSTLGPSEETRSSQSGASTLSSSSFQPARALSPLPPLDDRGAASSSVNTPPTPSPPRSRTTSGTTTSATFESMTEGPQAYSHPSRSRMTSGRTTSAASLPITERLRKLETLLGATRAALQSSRDIIFHRGEDARKVREATAEQLAAVGDSLELRENDMLRTRRELRSAQAEVKALEGRLAAEFREARKTLQQSPPSSLALWRHPGGPAGGVREAQAPTTRRVVWPNAGNKVVLVGSFDNWTNEIKMERSNAGVFVANLQLPPGRYLVKFVVDGQWRVDPNRQVVYTDGNENNVLTIF
eukprot:TRINITY_DN1666_c0_g2_i1.p1 TRINITY_DN1666_c0_g2~~TRINITY_DN1666_c0_g2_i1.p1  ORF type:complete len:629 (-),score=125.57 TRINITY_DN1666_c0_g2_i1:411-2081(-)